MQFKHVFCRSKRLVAMFAALTVAVAVSSASATFIEDDSAYLDELSGGQTLISGDKIFGDFEVVPIGSGASGGALAPDPSAILVTVGTETATGDHVMRLNLSLNAFSGQTVNATIRFTVAVDENYPDWYIEDAGLVLTGPTAAGDGGVNVAETIWDRSPTETGAVNLASLDATKSPGFTQLSEHTYFTPVKKIWVVKDISLTGGVQGSAHISEVIQTFSQIPEPASLALLAVGGLVMLKRPGRRS